ncbi:MAG: sulfite exporter TauE/SafE family protein [Bacteriovoracaceae bacterium]|nr:sulfite exporter TauE/SafE family protein [Bacteriovoracaceae bacterium]
MFGLTALSTLVLMGLSTATAFISGISGEAGGVMLFTFMTFFFTLDTLVPIHGVVQLASNSSRIYFLRNSLLKRFVQPFCVGAIIGVVLATWLKKDFPIDPKLPLALIVALILYVLFRPQKLPAIIIPASGFFFVGIMTGILGIYIGTVGPFVGAFFVRPDLKKEEIIANKAFMQGFTHLLKVPAFMSLGFSFIAAMPIIFLLVISTFIGSRFGVQILDKLEPKRFMQIMKGLLFFSAMRILYEIIYK